jgi:4-amino-4-deoxy-L-arabinose transferase-like glycosyltransferase
VSAAIDNRTARLAVTALALLYGAAHLAWYGTTPLGGFPVLDGREILEMAKAIAGGTLPAEPFYRAPLYPALIALFIGMGVPEGFLPDAARLLNLIAHVSSAILVFELARRVWDEVRAGLLAGALYALYPVALHFAGDPLDISLGSTLALGATLAAWLAAERSSWMAAVAAGALLALAALARPNFLVCLPALLLWFALLAWRDRRQLRLLASSILGCALVLGAMGLVNKAIGDEFRLLPWQGSHAIWDANGPGVSGLYYQHTIQIPDLVPGSNPARAEAEILYCRDRPCAEGIDIDDFQAYWRDRFVDYLKTNPGAWIDLMVSKTWYLVNNYEQYNNKTYWFHKDRAPWLRWNPLGWAVLLALGVGALWLPLRPPARSLLVLLASAYAVGLLLYFVSARFRVPMAGWLCVLAGGWATLAAHWRASPSGPPALVFAGMLTATVVGISSAVTVAETLRQGTVTEDWSLVASAALHAGKWREAEDWARKVIERTPERTVAVALVCSARVYAWEQSPTDALPPRAWLEESLSFCSKGASSSDRAAYNASFFLSGLCRNAEAEQIWRDLRESKLVGELSRNALAGLGHAPPDPADAVVGIAKLVATPLTELRPGQRSMLAALHGTQCAVRVSQAGSIRPE